MDKISLDYLATGTPDLHAALVLALREHHATTFSLFEAMVKYLGRSLDDAQYSILSSAKYADTRQARKMVADLIAPRYGGDLWHKRIARRERELQKFMPEVTVRYMPGGANTRVGFYSLYGRTYAAVTMSPATELTTDRPNTDKAMFICRTTGMDKGLTASIEFWLTREGPNPIIEERVYHTHNLASPASVAKWRLTGKRDLVKPCRWGSPVHAKTIAKELEEYANAIP
jgi:hypothetical protein